MSTFGTYDLYDRDQAAKDMASNGLPVPPDFGKANTFFSPIGPAPGRGWVLMLRRDIDKLDKNALHTLSLNDSGGNRVVIEQLCFIRARNLTAGGLLDPMSLFLVEIADRRYLAKKFQGSLLKWYNVRAPGYVQDATEANRFYASSLNTGALWTWTTMVQNIWSNLTTQLGAVPTLPTSPSGNPEEFAFPGVGAYDSLCQVLHHMGLAIKPVFTGSNVDFTLVQVGAADSAADALEVQLINNGQLIFDREFEEGSRAQVPRNVRVHFRRQQLDYGTELATIKTSDQFLTSSIYTVDVAGPDTSGENTYFPLWGDIPALYNAAGTIQNAATLSTRAAQIAADYYRHLRSTGGDDKYRTYTYLTSITPGSTVKAVVFRQDEGRGGWVTDVIRWSGPFLQVSDSGEWQDAAPAPIRSPEQDRSLPVYPQMLQKVKLTTGTADANGLFTATVQQYDPAARTWADKESCYAKEQNGVLSLTNGARYDGRLSGYDATGAPVYTVGFRFDPWADISPSQITGNTDNYAPTGLDGATVLRLNTDASRDITGLTGGADGRIIVIVNVGSNPIVLKNDVTSTAANRFLLPGGDDHTLQADAIAFIVYDSTSSRWRLIGSSSKCGYTALDTASSPSYILGIDSNGCLVKVAVGTC